MHWVYSTWMESSMGIIRLRLLGCLCLCVSCVSRGLRYVSSSTFSLCPILRVVIVLVTDGAWCVIFHHLLFAICHLSLASRWRSCRERDRWGIFSTFMCSCRSSYSLRFILCRWCILRCCRMRMKSKSYICTGSYINTGLDLDLISIFNIIYLILILILILILDTDMFWCNPFFVGGDLLTLRRSLNRICWIRRFTSLGCLSRSRRLRLTSR